MTPADRPIQRPSDARLLVVDASGHLRQAPRREFIDFLQPGDLIVANDAATLPASLFGIHVPTGLPIEVRLAGRHSLERRDIADFSAIVLGDGDFTREQKT